MRFEAQAPQQVLLAGVAPRVRFRDGDQETVWQAGALRPEGRHYVAGLGGGALQLQVRCDRKDDGWILHVRLENHSDREIRVDELAPLCVVGEGGVTIGAGIDQWAFYRNGFQSWSGTRVYGMAEADHDPWWKPLRVSTTDPARRSPGQPGLFRSELFTAIHNRRSRETLVIGFLGAARAFGFVWLDARLGRFRELAAACDFEGIPLERGAAIEAEPLWIGVGWDPQEVLERYAKRLGSAAKARVPRKAPIGWCSWYYYYTRVSESDVLENLDAIAGLRERIPFDYVMIDDGHQRAIGDWLETNEKFPHGMAWLAERIRERGLDAGLWIAPFIARTDSHLFRDHPRWFVRRPEGGLVGAMWNPLWGVWGQAYALDTTHPEVLQWLEELARAIVHRWGYRVLKLDFLYAAALPGLRHDPTATRAAALRRGLEALRRGAGRDAFLIGCGCPMGPAVGIVDAMRIGPDVATFWSNAFTRGPMRDLHGVATRHAVRNILTRAFLHRHLWLNDPDCVMVRDRETRLREVEIRSLATAVSLAGGMCVVSDRLRGLGDTRLGMLKQVIAAAGGECHVADLCDADPPQVVINRRNGDIRIAVFNFSDEPRHRVLDVGAWGIRDGVLEEMWSGAAVRVEDGWADLGVLPAHGCRLLRRVLAGDEQR